MSTADQRSYFKEKLHEKCKQELAQAQQQISELQESLETKTRILTKVVEQRDVIREERTQLQAENERLREALTLYASHLDDCELTPCTCKLFDMLAALTESSHTTQEKED